MFKHEFGHIGSTDWRNVEPIWAGFICVHCGMRTQRPIEELQRLSADEAGCEKSNVPPTVAELRTGEYDCVITMTSGELGGDKDAGIAGF